MLPYYNKLWASPYQKLNHIEAIKPKSIKTKTGHQVKLPKCRIACCALC